MHKLALLGLILTASTIPFAQAQFIAPGTAVPVIANLPGEAGTFWRSDLTITNLSEAPTTVTMILFAELIGNDPAFDQIIETLELDPGEQRKLSNVMQTRFGLTDAKGSLQIFSNEGAPLLVSSRTFTFGGCGGGSYGQNVEGIIAAVRGWVGGLRHDGFERSNLGIFWPWEEATSFTVTIYDDSGTEVGSGGIGFAGAGLRQLSLSNFGVDQLTSGYLIIETTSLNPFWAYVSTVDQTTGDAVFRPVRSRQADLPF